MKKIISSLIGFSLLSLSALVAQPYAYISNGTVLTQYNTVDGKQTNITAPGIFTHLEQSVLSSDGKTLYVVNLDDTVNGSVIVVDLTSNPPTATGASYPVGLYPQFIATDGIKLYVTNSGSGSVSVIDPATAQVTPIPLPSGSQPAGIAIYKTTAYVVLQGFGQVIPIDLTMNTPGAPFQVGVTASNLRSIAIDLTGTYGYVTDVSTSNLFAFQLASPMTVTTIPGIDSPSFGIAILPTDGSLAYVTSIDTGEVKVLDLKMPPGTTSATIKVGENPLGVTFSADGSKAYVANEADNSLSVITVADSSVVNVTLTGGTGPVFITLANFSLPFVASIAPTSGPAGSSAVLTGTNLAGVTSVAFGGVSAVFALNANGSITVIVPPGSGTVPVIVTSAGGPSAAVQFTYIPSPMNGNSLPPRSLRGCQYKRLTAHNPVNLIRFKAPCGSEKPVAYRIYRDAGLTDLAGTIKACRKLQFKDRNRVCGVVYTYFVVSVSSTGAQSAPVSVTVPK